MSSIPVINIGDTLELKKQHPCGKRLFKVLRVGADIKIECVGCKRTLTLDRVKIEKMIKKIIPGGNENE
ncbi:MAG: DUF951 domain-containing protein [Clostridia bacterium]|nr:DUF951 domain-containing protein [Clostridia bacterium]